VQVFEAAGWARSVGGVGPYLMAFARSGASREAVDKALEKREIHELPSARGCTYVLPARDFALGLAAGEQFACAEMKTAEKLGVTEKEIGKLRGAILKALEKGPLDPDALKTAVGSAVRSLGPEGAKKGIAGTLPVALGLMQAAGEIRRISQNGRLDQQRYKYALWIPNPRAGWKHGEEETFTQLGRRFFEWTGGASIAEFQWFSGLGVKAATVALTPLKLEAVDGRLMLPQDRAAWEEFKVPERPQYALVSSLDSSSQLRRDVKSLMVDADRARELGVKTAGVMDLPSHAIMDRGRLIGLWEFDPEGGKIAWWPWVKPDKALRETVERTEQFVREDLGDARGFSLDSPKSRAPRLAALRKAAGV
jgi:hypothetical protein